MRKLFLSSIAIILATVSAPATAFAGEIWLTMDQVRPYNLSDTVTSIVVGNPAIADVTVQADDKILLYGKAPGLTNIFFFNAEGERMENLNIRVKSPTGNMLVLHRGVAKATYSCTQQCEPTVSVGDSVDVFGQVVAQTAAKIGSATDAAASAPATSIAP